MIDFVFIVNEVALRGCLLSAWDRRKKQNAEKTSARPFARHSVVKKQKVVRGREKDP